MAAAVRRLGLALGLVLLTDLFAVAAEATRQNDLAGHPSPYLAMHGADPVHWQDWGPAALEAARRENKPLFISSGYFACHWCHVMQRESYRDPAIAALLNTYFIPVKIDRELHPALDAHLIAFVERTQGAAGWPLNVVLTPDGYPLVGMIYLPRDGLLRVLKQIVELWRTQREQLADLAKRGAQAAAGAVETLPAQPLASGALEARLASEALALADDLSGGFGRQSRFPMAPQLSALLELEAARPPSALGHFLALTLDQIAAEGLRDHLAGGFFRYTVDPGWQMPHFEKMLYTQALLARVYLQAADRLGRADFRDMAAETLDFILDRMAAPDGGYIASLSAVDAAGAEGGAYLWNEAQLAAVLQGDDLTLARRHWRLSEPPAAASDQLPRRGDAAETIAADAGRPVEVVRERLSVLRQRLLAARDRRSLPRDEKVLSGWNGLVLGALAEGAAQLNRPRYGEAAGALARHVVATFWDGQQLWRARGPQGPLGAAAIEDYAYLADGLDRYGRLLGDVAALRVRDALLASAWRRFFDPGTGWRAAVGALLPGMATEPALADGPMPSPAAVLIRLAAASADPALREQARQANVLARTRVQADPFWYASHVVALLPDSAVPHAGAVGE